MLDHGSWIQTFSTEAKDIEVLEGSKRATKIHPEFKVHVAELAAAGELVGSGAAAIKAMKMWKTMGKRGIGLLAPTANRWLELFNQRYFAASRVAMQNVQEWVLGITLDASRFGGRELLAMALWSCQTGVGMWMPPQAWANSIQNNFLCLF